MDACHKVSLYCKGEKRSLHACLPVLIEAASDENADTTMAADML